LRTELFTPTDVEIRPSERLVGNPGGINLLSRLEKLEQQVMRVSREHAEHQDRYHEVRKCTLDDWSSQARDYTGEHISRNDSVHGGSVAADIEVISSYDGTERAELWKQAFERSYGVSFETLKRHWLHVSDELLLIRVCRPLDLLGEAPQCGPSSKNHTIRR
jgi:hypothetical protein